MSQDICLLFPPILTDTICCHSSATAVLQTNKQTGLLKSETVPFAVSWAAFTRDQCGLVPFGLDPIWYGGGGSPELCWVYMGKVSPWNCAVPNWSTFITHLVPDLEWIS